MPVQPVTAYSQNVIDSYMYHNAVAIASGPSHVVLVHFLSMALLQHALLTTTHDCKILQCCRNPTTKAYRRNAPSAHTIGAHSSSSLQHSRAVAEAGVLLTHPFSEYTDQRGLLTSAGAFLAGKADWLNRWTGCGYEQLHSISSTSQDNFQNHSSHALATKLAASVLTKDRHAPRSRLSDGGNMKHSALNWASRVHALISFPFYNEILQALVGTASRSHAFSGSACNDKLARTPAAPAVGAPELRSSLPYDGIVGAAEGSAGHVHRIRDPLILISGATTRKAESESVRHVYSGELLQ